jgi:hypothetical protein
MDMRRILRLLNRGPVCRREIPEGQGLDSSATGTRQDRADRVTIGVWASAIYVGPGGPLIRY